MSDFHRSKIRAQEIQAHREAEIKREIAAKKEKDVSAAKDLEARRKRLDEAAAEARRQELRAANAALNPVVAAPAVQSARSVEYNPFAEDEFEAPSIAGPSKLKPGGGRSGVEKNGLSGPREKKLGGSAGGSVKTKKDKERESSPPLLGRKERAARALAQQLKKKSKNEPFSIRALVETEERGGSYSPLPTSKSSLQPHINHANRPILPIVPKKLVAPGKKGAGNTMDLRKLAPGRDAWDRRSIDEIARDLKASRVKADPPPMGRTKSSERVNGTGDGKISGGSKRPRSTSPIKTSAVPARSKPKPPPIPSSARPPPASRPSTSIPTNGKRSRLRSPSDYSSSSSTPPPSRRSRLPDPDDVADVSATIQALFRRPGGAAPRRYAASDASSDDMEARMSDVEEEERRAARIARLEDEAAEREERERKEKKERLKRAGR